MSDWFGFFLSRFLFDFDFDKELLSLEAFERFILSDGWTSERFRLETLLLLFDFFLDSGLVFTPPILMYLYGFIQIKGKCISVIKASRLFVLHFTAAENNKKKKRRKTFLEIESEITENTS